MSLADDLKKMTGPREQRPDPVPFGNGAPQPPAPRQQRQPQPASTSPSRGWKQGEGASTSTTPAPMSRGMTKFTGSSASDIRRTLPHSLEAEQGVLGSMLISPREIIGECVEKISEEYFYVPAHQTIYTVLVDLWNAGSAIDLITFTQVLRDRGLLDVVGGAVFITSLFTFVPTSANITYYLEIVRDKHILRQMVAAFTEGVRRSFEDQDEVNALLDEMEQKVFAIGEDRFKSAMASMKDNVMGAVDTIEAAYERKGGVTGLATGFSELDRMTGGLQRQEMIVIAARPSMGKTALAMNIAEHVALELKKPVAVFSLEMSKEQLSLRLLCSRARVNLQKARDGWLSERDFPAITAAAGRFSEAPLYIDDTPGLSVLELRAKARRLRAMFHVELVIVDYLQLLRSLSRKANDNRQIEISEISSGIKSLAKELGIPIVVCAQLNRQPEGRYRGKPRLSDLRESGSIEQDADVVALLTRPEVYEEDPDLRAELAGEAELIIAKQRNGPTGDIPLTFLRELTRFEDRAQNYVDGDLDKQ